MRTWRGFTGALLGLVLLGCGPAHMAKTRFGREYSCNKDISVRSLGADSYRVSGCSRTATYVCKGTTCIREYSEDHSTTYVPVAVRSDPAPRAGNVAAAKREDGARTLKAKIGSKSFSLHMQATPGKDDGVVFLGLRIRSREKKHEDCTLRIMADGELLDTGETGYRMVSGYEELRATISYDDLFRWGDSGRVVGRVCDDEFRIGAERLDVVREFVVRLREEMTWLEHEDGKADEGASEQAGEGETADDEGDAAAAEEEERGELL